jgi:hypothetical protein
LHVRVRAGPVQEVDEGQVILRCIQTTEPACHWVGGSERDLIRHYLIAHYAPKAEDFVIVSNHLREAHREIEQLRRTLGRVGLSV